jgi:anaerobic magnesium-protoporphyrin IX monomethyl ester cyclase
MKTALVSLNVSYIHKNLALRTLMVTKPIDQEAVIFEGLCKAPLALLDKILSYQPQVVAFSVYIFNIDATIALIQALKIADPSLKIVAGGPEATHHPKPLWDNGIDGVFRGETELVFWDTLVGKNSQGYQDHPEAKAQILIADLSVLETFPSPYFLPMDEKDMEQRYLYVETARGCPYGCTYCMASLDRQVRPFSDNAMNAFFAQLKNTKVRQVKFLDRTFNLNKARSLNLAKLCLSMPESMHFHIELVGDTLDEELKTLLITQGKDRFRMEIGVQSLNLKTLNEVGRTSDLNKLLNLIEAFAAHGMKQHVDLIAGLPYEDLNSFKASYKGLIDLKPHEIQVGILKLLHGSAIRDKAQDYGYIAQEAAPYQIKQSHWMRLQDIQSVERVALSTEKAYNSQKLKAELDRLFEDSEHNPYDVMEHLGLKINALTHPYTNQAFYLALYEGLCEVIPEPKAKRLINHAYYRNSPLFPPSLFHNHVDKKTLNDLREHLSLTQNDKHLVLIDRIDSSKGWECWIYRSQPQSKLCLILDENHHLEKETHETLTGHSQPQ